jgi:hypothetical protein
MYSYYRRIRSIGRTRAWYAAKADRVTWDEESYPPPPEMRYPGTTILSGSWADIPYSYIRVNRYSRVRGMVIESQGKIKRLRKRHEARKYRAYQKRTGNL